MKTLFIECGMGAAGDMLSGALLELLSDKQQEEFISEINGIGIPGVSIEREYSSKCGINGSHIIVRVHGQEEDENMHDHHHEAHHHEDHHHEDHHHEDHHHEDHHLQHQHSEDEHSHSHSHNSMSGIEHIVMDHLKVSDKVKQDIMAVYNIIAKAEAQVHKVDITNIHFHEVGTMDAVADIAMVCMLMEKIAADKVYVSSIHVGKGQVKCAHGILPVPAPATALILTGIPIYSGNINGELCTPTGAALLKYFADDFADMPQMTISKIGYGMGKKDFEIANCVRVMLGEEKGQEKIIELSFNVDDMTGESIGFLTEETLKNGALEAFTIPVQMKKSRPGSMIVVLCKTTDKDKFVEMIFKHSTTIGIRQKEYSRYTLDRKSEEVDTPYGMIRRKISEGYGVVREKYEHEDIAKVARENGISIEEVKNKLKG